MHGTPPQRQKPGRKQPAARVTWTGSELCHNSKKPGEKAGLLKLNGGQRGTRTPGTGIFNPLLYQLSYLTGSRKRGLEYYVLCALRSSDFANFVDDFLCAAIRTRTVTGTACALSGWLAYGASISAHCAGMTHV